MNRRPVGDLPAPYRHASRDLRHRASGRFRHRARAGLRHHADRAPATALRRPQ
ncbi:hypothetical protein ACFZA9_32870 [Streptomyces olivaceus]|uniref:hypothetical protein n=1 Tax=Streptomyces olivaceus TaxID=47716 RepID=UPI0036E2324C